MSIFSDYLAKLRAEGDKRSEEEIALEAGSQLNDSELQQYKQLDPDFGKLHDYAQRKLYAPPLPVEVGRALSAGVDQMQGGLWGALASTARDPSILDITGLSKIAKVAAPDAVNPWKQPNPIGEWVADRADEMRVANQEEAAQARGPVTIQNLEDARSVSDYARLFATGAAQNVPSMAPAIAAGLLTKNPAISTVMMGGLSAAQNIGEQYGNLVDAGVDKTKAAEVANIGGALAGALDSLALGRILGTVSLGVGAPVQNLKSRLIARLIGSPAGRRIADGVIAATEGAAAEGVTEAMQEAIAMVGEEYAGHPVSDEEWNSRLLNAGAQGGFLGGLLGGGVGTVQNETNETINRGQRIQDGWRTTKAKLAEAEAARVRAQQAMADDVLRKTEEARAATIRLIEEAGAEAASVEQSAVLSAEEAHEKAWASAQKEHDANLQQARQNASEVVATAQYAAEREQAIDQLLASDPQVIIQRAIELSGVRTQDPYVMIEKNAIERKFGMPIEAIASHAAIAARRSAVENAISEMVPTGVTPEIEKSYRSMKPAEGVAVESDPTEAFKKRRSAELAAERKAAEEAAKQAAAERARMASIDEMLAEGPVALATRANKLAAVENPTPLDKMEISVIEQAMGMPLSDIVSGKERSAEAAIRASLMEQERFDAESAAEATAGIFQGGTIEQPADPRTAVEQVLEPAPIKAYNNIVEPEAAKAASAASHDVVLPKEPTRPAKEAVKQPAAQPEPAQPQVLKPKLARPDAIPAGIFVNRIDSTDYDTAKKAVSNAKRLMVEVELPDGSRVIRPIRKNSVGISVGNISTNGKKLSDDLTGRAGAPLSKLVDAGAKVVRFYEAKSEVGPKAESFNFSKEDAETFAKTLEAKKESLPAPKKVKGDKVLTYVADENAKSPAEILEEKEAEVAAPMDPVAETRAIISNFIEQAKVLEKAELASAIEKAKAKLAKVYARDYPDRKEHAEEDADWSIRTAMREAGLTKGAKRSLRRSGSWFIDPGKARDSLARVMRWAESNGYDIALLRQEIDSELEILRSQGGAVIDDRMIALVMQNLQSPSSVDVATAYHEIAHPFLDKLSPQLAQHFHIAIESMDGMFQSDEFTPDIRIIANLPESSLTESQRAILKSVTKDELAAIRSIDRETLATEIAADHLASVGMSRDLAKGLIEQVISDAKEVFYSIAYAIAKAFRADSAAQFLARRYVEQMFINSISRANEGTVMNRFDSWIGNHRLDAEEKIDIVTNLDGHPHPAEIDLDTGKISYRPHTAHTVTEVIDNLRNALASQEIEATKRRGQLKPLPADAIIAVQPPYDANGIKYPGHVSINFPDDGENRSASPEQLVTEGYDIRDYSDLPMGSYTPDQANELVDRVANDARDRTFMGEMSSIQIVRDSEGNLLAPNGKKSKLDEYKWKVVRTPSFKRFFGDWENDPKNASKVVDVETGEPLVVYHGTGKRTAWAQSWESSGGFLEFNTKSTSAGTHFGTPDQSAFFVDPSRGVAAGHIYPVFLSLKNPISLPDVFSKDSGGIADEIIRSRASRRLDSTLLQRLRVLAERYNTYGDGAVSNADLQEALLSSGYDGATYLNQIEGDTSLGGGSAWVAFSPTQIKSATGNIGTFDTKNPRIDRSYRRAAASSTVSPKDQAEWQSAAINFQQRTWDSIYAWMKPSLPTGMAFDVFIRKVVGYKTNTLPLSRALAIAEEMKRVADPTTGAPLTYNAAVKIDQLPEGSMRDQAIEQSYAELVTVVRRMAEMQATDQAEYDRLAKRKAGRGITADEQARMDQLSTMLAIRSKVMSHDDGIRAQMRDLESALDVVNESHYKLQYVPDSIYYVPKSADSSATEVLEGKTKFKLAKRTGEAPTQAELIKWAEDIQKVTDWLANPKNAKNGSVYNLMRRQWNTMVALNVNERTKAIRGVMRTSWFKSIPDSLRNIGLASARRLATRYYKYTETTRKYANRAEVIGHKWLTAQHEARVAMGLKNVSDKEFQATWMSQALRILGDVNTGNARDTLFREMEKRGLKVKQSAQGAFWNFIETYREADKFLTEIVSSEGIMVLDKDLGIQRRLIELGNLTASRRLADSVFDMVINMTGTPWDGLKAGQFDGFADKYSQDRQRALDGVNTLFSEYAVDNFLRPLVTDNRSHFRFWSHQGNRSLSAQTFNIRQAFDNATKYGQFSFDDFITSLHALSGGTPGTEGTTAELVLNDLALRWHRLTGIVSDLKESNDSKTAPTVSRQLMDARKADDLPAEFIEFAPHDPSTLRAMMSRLSAAAAFGRDGFEAGGETFAERQLVEDQLRSLRDQWNVLESQGASAKQKIEHFTRRYGAEGRAMYDTAKAAEQSLRYIKQLPDITRAMMRERGNLHDLNFIDRLMGVIASWTVAAPRSALGVLMDPVNIYHVTGVSRTTLETILKQVPKTMASDFVTSSARDLGINILLNADAARRRTDYIGGDPGNAISIKSRMLDYGMGSEQQKGIGRATHWAHMMQVPLELGVSDLKKKKAKIGTDEAAAPKLRFLNPFRFIQQSANNTVIDGMYELTKRMYANGVEMIERAPDKDALLRKLRTGIDQNGKPFELSAEELGMGWVDANAFAYLKEILASKIRAGTLERQIADAYERSIVGRQIANTLKGQGKSDAEIHAELRKANGFLVDDETYAGIASVVLDEIALEPGLGSDSPFFTNPVLKPLMPLLSFPIKAAQRFPKMFKDPAGQVAMSSMLKGTASLMLIGIPATLAFSLAMDEFDDKILGKKSDLRDPDTAGGVLERLARYGVGGLYGEAVAGVASAQQGMRPFDPASRIMIVSKFNSLMQLSSNLFLADPPFDWANFGRPALQILGGNNVIQYMQGLNAASGGSFSPTEYAMTARTSSGNYLRASGRELGLDVRKSGGGTSFPTPVTPWVAAMERAALLGDVISFDSAFRKAIDVSMETNGISREEAKKRVKSAFQARHPLRSVFKTPPTEAQYQDLLMNMDSSGAATVSNSISAYNRFLRRLGMHEFDGTDTRSGSSNPRTMLRSIRQSVRRDAGISDIMTARKLASEIWSED